MRMSEHADGSRVETDHATTCAGCGRWFAPGERVIRIDAERGEWTSDGLAPETDEPRVRAYHAHHAPVALRAATDGVRIIDREPGVTQPHE